jgi:hypothetical protein
MQSPHRAAGLPRAATITAAGFKSTASLSIVYYQMGGTALNITSSSRITASNHPLKTPFFQITPIKRDNRLQQ